MFEGQRDPASAKKVKKMEKPQEVSTNREYLDMDTDEEEFGRQETPEPEEELELEPEKPVFTAEEIAILVQYIKDLTTLASLTDADWSQEVLVHVEEYFRSPANTVLTIFWEAKKLKALLQFPSNFDRGLTYFLRAPWQVYTSDNFMSTIIFGSIDSNVDNSTLKFMENVYAPTAFHSDEWPTVMRNELCSNLNEFLLCLTDATYNPMGLTILYVPREGLRDDENLKEIEEESKSLELIEKAISEPRDEDEEGLLERLERVARYWIRQIREALKGPFSCSLTAPGKTIVDEISFWKYRYENLSCVYQQLMNKSVISIVKKLEIVESASVKQFNPLVTEVRGMLDEAISNIKYLNLLEEFSKGFVIPDGVEEYAIKILLLIKFIGTESPFYNTGEKMETLCRAFCVQAVDHCRDSIDLDIVLDGDADAGRKLLIKCIESCEILSGTYDRLADMDKISESPTISLAEKSKVFNHVDTLVHRCNDLIGIADARIAFDKSDEPIIICGPRGLELGSRYRNIEERFTLSLSEIKKARDIILDIASAAWLDHIVAFKRGLKDIENMVKNWIADIFEDVLNVDEGIEALHGIARFSRRPYLRETLNNKWIQIWKMFGDELESCTVETNRHSVLYHPSLPPLSGQANIYRNNKIYLMRQYKMLIDASDWFGDCDAQTTITRKYKRVLAAMTEKENLLFSAWQNEIADTNFNPITISNRPIIKYHNNSKLKTIAANLQMCHLAHIKEAREWTNLNYDAKTILPKGFPKWETLQSRYNKVEYLCKMYNSIGAGAADHERSLFHTLLDDLEETLSSGFKKVTWISDLFERFFTDCIDIITNIQESFEVYRGINCKVDYLIENIAITTLLNIADGSLNNLEDCETHLEQDRCHGVTLVNQNCKLIFKLLLGLKNRIYMDDKQTEKYWDQYADEIYGRIKNAFTSCMRLSLLCALEFLHSDTSLIKIDADSSKIRQVEEEIVKINASVLKEALPVEEFGKLFHTIDNDGISMIFESIDQDPQCNDLINEIKEFFKIY